MNGGSLEEIRREAKRIFPDGRLFILEEFPFYLKVRILLREELFVEIRINERNRKKSYALVEQGKRIAGFDNLGGWHFHPYEKPNAHEKMKAPSLRNALEYFRDFVLVGV